MSLYHLHARMMHGPLNAPDPESRYERQSRESDDLDEVRMMAKDLASRGFTVVIYDHGHRPRSPDSATTGR